MSAWIWRAVIDRKLVFAQFSFKPFWALAVNLLRFTFSGRKHCTGATVETVH